MEDNDRPVRKFIRHTADVPIHVRTLPGDSSTTTGLDISEGGLSFVFPDEVPLGTIVQVGIDDVDPPFVANARVVWSRPEDDEWCIGVEFLDPSDSFRARMVEQVCAIEQYVRKVEEEEGRKLSRSEGAREWIARYAKRFPAA
jgi:hypothetical protein